MAKQRRILKNLKFLNSFFRQFASLSRLPTSKLTCTSSSVSICNWESQRYCHIILKSILVWLSSFARKSSLVSNVNASDDVINYCCFFTFLVLWEFFFHHKNFSPVMKILSPIVRIFLLVKILSPIVRFFLLLWEFFSCFDNFFFFLPWEIYSCRENFFPCCENLSLVVTIFWTFNVTL